jgi:uridylate kinase
MSILIKFSGEFFQPSDSMSLDGEKFLDQIVQIDPCYIVTGGGNRLRGRDSNYDRNAADNIGVLSTLMNAFILKENLRLRGKESVVFSHFNDFGEPYDANKAKQAIKDGKFVIFGSGLGKVGYISTDTASVIKALEVGACGIIKITKIGGVFDKIPLEKDSKLLDFVSYDFLLQKGYEVLDLPALALAKGNNLSVAVMDIKNFTAFLNGEKVGSIIGSDFRK